METLNKAVETVRQRIKRYGQKSINEQDTKASLIQPILRAVGWDVEDLDEIQREYKRRKQDTPVDYAVFLLRSPCMFLEAKALGKNLDDRRWANQIMGYAGVASVEWVVLTDGNEYRLYNSHAPVPVEDKLFRTIRISEDVESAIEFLALLSKERMQENEIDILWIAHFVDRQVQSEIQSLFENEPDASLVRLLKRRLESLSAREIRESLRRAEIQFDFPIKALPGDKPPDSGRRKSLSKRQSKNEKSVKAKRRVTLSDLLAAGVIHAPLTLCRHYMGHDLKATVQADGKIEFEGEHYASPSLAAATARSTIIGRLPATNGWVFWQFKVDGEYVELTTARDQLKSR